MLVVLWANGWCVGAEASGMICLGKASHCDTAEPVVSAVCRLSPGLNDAAVGEYIDTRTIRVTTSTTRKQNPPLTQKCRSGKIFVGF